MTNNTKQPPTSTDTVQIDKESLQVLVSTAHMYGQFVEANVKPSTEEERLAEGYRKRSERSQQLAEEMAHASSEATGPHTI